MGDKGMMAKKIFAQLHLDSEVKMSHILSLHQHQDLFEYCLITNSFHERTYHNHSSFTLDVQIDEDGYAQTDIHIRTCASARAHTHCAWCRNWKLTRVRMNEPRESNLLWNRYWRLSYRSEKNDFRIIYPQFWTSPHLMRIHAQEFAQQMARLRPHPVDPQGCDPYQALVTTITDAEKQIDNVE